MVGTPVASKMAPGTSVRVRRRGARLPWNRGQGPLLCILARKRTKVGEGVTAPATSVRVRRMGARLPRVRVPRLRLHAMGRGGWWLRAGSTRRSGLRRHRAEESRHRCLP